MRVAAKVATCAAAILLCLLMSPFVAYAQSSSPAISIRTVEIQGNRRVDRSTVFFYIGLKEGQAYTNVNLVEQIRKDVQTIYGLGFFRDVRVDVEPFEGGLKVIYRLVEKPTINRVEIFGNSKVKSEDILQGVTAKVQTIVNESAVKESVRNIRRLYQQKGYYFARVEAVLKQGRSNTMAVIFQVDEGENVWIETITFRGNENISRKDILSAMETGEWGIFSWITDSGIYEGDTIQKDLLRTRALYQSRGFLKVQVGQPIIREDRERGKLNITIPISEGLQYTLAEVEIRGGEDVIPPEELKKELQMFVGDVFNRSLMTQDVRGITNSFAQRGYAFVDVRPTIKTDDVKKTANLRVDIKKGRRVYIGRVNFKGNTRTRENVVRREVRVKEGSLYDARALGRTRGRLQALGYFSSVKVLEKKRPGSEDVLDIDIEVNEQPTGSIAGGIGFNNRTGVQLTAQIQENNFFGTGLRALASARFSGVGTDFLVTIEDPNFKDKDFSLGFDAFLVDQDFVSFDTRTEGGRVRIGKELREFFFLTLEYELSNSKVLSVSSTAPQSIVDQENDTLLSSRFTPTFSYDTRNRRILTDKGRLIRLQPSITGGPLGGDVDVGSFLTEYRQWYNIGETLRLRLLKKLVWSFRVRGQYVDSFKGDLPAFRRLFLDDLRGFTLRDLGPKDSSGDSLGGFSSGIASTELRHPFFGPTQFVVFLEAGNVWERHNAFDLSDIRSSVGVGMRIFTPIGPLRLDVGWKLDKRRGERARETHFGLGTQF
ncbi:MAG: outer membrane protein assembly factor BamA [bacterium]|nr:outer membrane protein assembly factor BamA [bacterium]